MSLSRRTFLAAASSLPILGLSTGKSLSSLSLGGNTLTTVSDGNLQLPKDLVFDGLPENEVNAILQEYGVPDGPLKPDCNLALYQDGERTVLFDVGSGPDFMSSAGKVGDSLDALGMTTDDITHVVFTHAHPDHLWGLLDDFDDPLFTNATYMMGRDEWDYWWNPDTVNTIGEARVPFAVGAKRRMEAIEDQIDFFDPEQEVLPGIQAISTKGHTPGHMSFEVRHGSESALIIGDAIANQHVAFRKPEWQSGNDQDRETAVESRKMLFDRIISEKMKIVGFHLPNGGIGRAEAAEEGFTFIPENT